MEILILSILALVTSGISFYLWVRNVDKISKSMLVYSVVSTVIVVGISYALCVIYEENTLVFNIKRVALLSMLWPIAYIDFFEYKNIFIS